MIKIYTVSNTTLAHYNFNAHQPILTIFGRDVAQRVCYQMVMVFMYKKYYGPHIFSEQDPVYRLNPALSLTCDSLMYL